jgi:hypothetical protein
VALGDHLRQHGIALAGRDSMATARSRSARPGTAVVARSISSTRIASLHLHRRASASVCRPRRRREDLAKTLAPVDRLDRPHAHAPSIKPDGEHGEAAMRSSKGPVRASTRQR